MARARLATTFALAALLAAASPSATATATSVIAAPPHDPRLGCAAILHLIANLNAGRARDERALFGPDFFTDALGKVEESEEAAFLHAMRNNEGHADAGPIRLYHAFRIHADRVRPIYLVVLERRVWHEIRIEEDSMFNIVETPDPRHYDEMSYWTASFGSNRIEVFRQASDLYPMMVGSTELADCTSP